MQTQKYRHWFDLTRFYNRNPEKLWIHYVFAVVLVCGLTVLTHILDRNADQRIITATQAIKDSETMIVQLRETLDLAIAWDRQSDPDAIALRKAIGSMERLWANSALHHNMIAEDAVAAVFANRTLTDRVDFFIGLARSMVDAEGANTGLDRTRLLSLYQQGYFYDAFLQEIQMITSWIESASIQKVEQRNRLVLAILLVILAEATLIFWPAHVTVISSFKKLQHQASVLHDSKARLGQLNQKLQDMLRHDYLTGLPNRTSLIDYLNRIILRQEGVDRQLYLFDVDGLKIINETMGHDHGDELLVNISAALKDCIDIEDFIARMDGDTFAIISTEESDVLLRRIATATGKPFTIKGRQVSWKMSVGYIAIGTEIRKPSDILSDAKIALQTAKTQGRGQACAFDMSLRDERAEKQLLQIELQEAIHNGEIEPWFQPQINLCDGTLHGVEVLARWRHPKHGILTPIAFLEVAERSGLISELDYAVWKAAMLHARGWQDQHIWQPLLSLNASPDTLADPRLVERLLLILHRSGLRPDQVIIEVLESTLIESTDDMAAINADQLAECGIGLELDDFGTGYGSLSKLAQLPLTGIKLDRSLVTPLPEPAASSVVRAILTLAHELGMCVVAEGIEDSQQAKHLHKSGCQVGQGFGYGRPMPADAFKDWLRRHAGHPISLSEPETTVARRA
jgi:diguanylate cyclase (GGDEF)-like protein